MTKCMHPISDIVIDGNNMILDIDDKFMYIGHYVFCKTCLKQYEIETCRISRSKLKEKRNGKQ